MKTIHRPHLERLIEEGLERPGPAVLVVRGGPRTGKSTAVRGVLRSSRRSLAIRGTAGPATRHRRDFATTLRRAGIECDDEPSWEGGVHALLARLDLEREPRLLVVDEVHHLHRADPDFGRALATLWSGARARALPLHLVLVSSDDALLDSLLGEGGPLEAADPLTVDVDDLSTAEIRDHLPDWSPRDRFLLQACLGRSPSTLGHVEPEIRLATNLHRLVVDPEGPLHDEPVRRLERLVQRPERYAGILAALAEGARDWRSIHAANPAFASGNQLAPYLATLKKLGWLKSERSLDAPPRGRKRRYHLADPFVAFWYGVVDPLLSQLLEGAPSGAVWRSTLAGRPFARHAAAVLPRALQRVLSEAGDPLLGARARRIGGLWGEGYDLPIAATLRNGAVLYATTVWQRIATLADADAVHRQMRATRYGFGREARIRVVFAGAGSTEPLVRRSARDELLRVIPIERAF